MNKIKAFIERGNDGTYSVYVDLEDNTLNYGIFGEGNTVQEAVDDFKEGYLEMKALFDEEKKHFVEADFEFYYDTASFLQFYTNYFSLAGLERVTGINQRQLSHYVNGHKTPRPATVKKIETSLQMLSRELAQVHFISPHGGGLPAN
jgi:predicted RNase H-like HicB family nuclease